MIVEDHGNYSTNDGIAESGKTLFRGESEDPHPATSSVNAVLDDVPVAETRTVHNRPLPVLRVNGNSKK